MPSRIKRLLTLLDLTGKVLSVCDKSPERQSGLLHKLRVAFRVFCKSKNPAAPGSSSAAPGFSKLSWEAQATSAEGRRVGTRGTRSRTIARQQAGYSFAP